MAGIADALREELQNEEYSEGYAESFLDSYVATQLKVLREQNEWTQTELAAKIKTAQTTISRIENVNYSAWNISTLKKLARAFRLRLHVSFETYGSLIDEVGRFNRESLKRTPREEDPALGKREEKPQASANQDGVGFMEGDTMSNSGFPPRKEPAGTNSELNPADASVGIRQQERDGGILAAA